MTTSLTEGRHSSEAVMWEEDFNFSRDNVTLKAGTSGQVVKANTIMAQLDASPYKWVPCVASASDGSQTAKGMLLYDTDITADVVAVMLVRSAQVNADCLVYDATVNDAPKKAVLAASLASVGIIVRD